MRWRGEARQRAALELDVAVGEAIDAADAVEQRGLAGAVRADQAADLAVADVERDAAQRDDAAEAHRHVGNAEQRIIGPFDRHQAVRAAYRATRSARQRLPIRAPCSVAHPSGGLVAS